jgi:hypothetical protein
MKASFDGARRNLSDAYNRVARSLSDGLQNTTEEALRKRMNDLRSAVVGLNCMYDPEQKDDCNEIDIELIAM